MNRCGCRKSQAVSDVPVCRQQRLGNALGKCFWNIGQASGNSQPQRCIPLFQAECRNDRERKSCSFFQYSGYFVFCIKYDLFRQLPLAVRNWQLQFEFVVSCSCYFKEGAFSAIEITADPESAGSRHSPDSRVFPSCRNTGSHIENIATALDKHILDRSNRSHGCIHLHNFVSV